MAQQSDQMIIGESTDRAGRRYRLIEQPGFEFRLESTSEMGVWELEDEGGFEGIRGWGREKWREGERKLVRDLRLKLKGTFVQRYQHMHPDAEIIGWLAGSFLYAGSPMHTFYVRREITVWAVPVFEGRVWIVVYSWYPGAWDDEEFEPEGFVVGNGTTFDIDQLPDEVKRVTAGNVEGYPVTINESALQRALETAKGKHLGS